MPESRVSIGKAGWSLPKEHQGRFPEDGTHLARYGRVLNAVEVNSSFKKTHRPSTYERWADSVPDGFRFSVKIPREISHGRRLEEAEGPLDEFLEGVSRLGGKLGPVLLQLPPSLEFDRARVESFFDAFEKRHSGMMVVEPRHESWFGDEVDSLLADRRYPRVAADPAPVERAGEPAGWDGLVYYRLHGSPEVYRSAYDQEFLEGLAERLRGPDAGKERWVIFDNTAAGNAIPNALALMELLGISDTG